MDPIENSGDYFQCDPLIREVKVESFSSCTSKSMVRMSDILVNDVEEVETLGEAKRGGGGQ